MRKCGNLVDLKLEFLNTYYKKENLPDKELIWLQEIYNDFNITNMKITENHKQIAYDLFHKYSTIHLKEKVSCNICGKALYDIDSIIMLCDDCISRRNITKQSRKKCTRAEQEYIDNFYSVVKEGKYLTPIGFNEISKISYHTYQNYYKIKWTEIVKKYGKYDELFNYIINEFKEYNNKTNNNSYKNFTDLHKYITSALIRHFDLDEIYLKCGIKYLIF
jgi:hypothetical protein